MDHAIVAIGGFLLASRFRVLSSTGCPLHTRH